MDQFPRIELFAPKEIRRAAVLGAVAVALLAGALVYVRPSFHSAPAAAATARPPGATVVSIAAPTASIAYATRLDYTKRARDLYRTDDGGRSWRRVALPEAMMVFGVSVEPGDRNDVLLSTFAAGFNPPTLPAHWLSHDRGAHWSAVALPAGVATPRSIQLVDLHHWFITTVDADGFSVRESTDEGVSWPVVVNVRGPDPQIDGVSLTQAAPVVVVTGGAVWLEVTEANAAGRPTRADLVYTVDGGKTWTTASLPELPDGVRLGAGFSLPVIDATGHGYITVFPVQGRVVANGSFTSIVPYLSTTGDGGRTWSPLRNLEHYPVFTVAGGRDWWAASGTTLYSSSDLGLTWSQAKAAVPGGARLQQIFRATPNVAWSVFANVEGGLVSAEPDRSHVLRTTDGGRHWSDVAFPGL